MKIGIIGAGNVGGALARRFSECGHEIKVGIPDPTKEKYKGLNAVTPTEAAEFGELVFFAIPWTAAKDSALSLANVVKAKIVVDCTNPISADRSGLELGHKDSGGKQFASWLPESTVVKAFNTIGYNIMANPSFGGTPATLLVAGDDNDAKIAISALAKQIGFEPVDVGPLERATQMEALAWLWITHSIKTNNREFAFNLVRR